jgi:hypothetical protein
LRKEEKRKEGGQKVFYNFLEYIIFYKTFLKKASFLPLFLSPIFPPTSHTIWLQWRIQ